MLDVRASAFSDNNWSVSIAHARAARQQCVFVGDVGIRVDGNRGNMQLTAPRALIQRLNIFQPMVETITAKIDFVFGHCVEHEGIVGIRRVTQRKEFSVLLRTAMHESLRGLCKNIFKGRAEGIEIDARRYRNKTAAAEFRAAAVCYNCMREGADFSNSAPRKTFYRFSTICGAGLTISSWALTFWIWAACSLSWAVRVSICLCCCVTVACNFSTLLSSLAWCSAFAAGCTRPRGAGTAR